MIEVMDERRKQATHHHNDACKLFEQGNHEEALRRFLAAIEYDPTQFKLRLGAAKALVALGKLEDAFKQSEMAIGMAPEDQHAKETAFDVYISKASKHFEAEEWVEMVGWCRKAILVCPEDPEATNIFNLMYNTWGEKPGCVEPVMSACRAIVAKGPQWNYARYRLGRILLDSQHPEEAVPILREAVQREPTNAEYRDWLCLALMAADQGDAAMEQFRILEETAPERAEKFKQHFREVAIQMLRNLRDVDLEEAKEFQQKLGPGLIDPEETRNN